MQVVLYEWMTAWITLVSDAITLHFSCFFTESEHYLHATFYFEDGDWLSNTVMFMKLIHLLVVRQTL